MRTKVLFPGTDKPIQAPPPFPQPRSSPISLLLRLISPDNGIHNSLGEVSGEPGPWWASGKGGDRKDIQDLLTARMYTHTDWMQISLKKFKCSELKLSRRGEDLKSKVMVGEVFEYTTVNSKVIKK